MDACKGGWVVVESAAWPCKKAPLLASYTIAIRVLIFVLLPGWGLSNAAATLVGQNLRTNQPERAETAVCRAGLYSMLFRGAAGVFFILFAEAIIRLFHGWSCDSTACGVLFADIELSKYWLCL